MLVDNGKIYYTDTHYKSYGKIRYKEVYGGDKGSKVEKTKKDTNGPEIKNSSKTNKQNH